MVAPAEFGLIVEVHDRRKHRGAAVGTPIEKKPEPEEGEKEKEPPKALAPRPLRPSEPIPETMDPKPAADPVEQKSITSPWGLVAFLVRFVPLRVLQTATVFLLLLACAYGLIQLRQEYSKLDQREAHVERQDRALAALQQQTNEASAQRITMDDRLTLLEDNSAGFARWICSKERLGPQCDWTAKSQPSSPAPAPKERHVEGTSVTILPNP